MESSIQADVLSVYLFKYFQSPFQGNFSLNKYWPKKDGLFQQQVHLFNR